MFGTSLRGPVCAQTIVDDLRREVTSLLDPVQHRCSLGPDADGEVVARTRADLRRLGDDLAGVARSLRSFSDPLRVVLLGRTQAGKSTVFTYLTRSDASPIGRGAQRCTRSIVEAPMADDSNIVIVDTPGVGARDGDNDRKIALEAARSADLVVWVATNNSQPSETAASLTQVAKWGVPLILAFNCREDLGGTGAIEQFLTYPDDVFEDLVGHRARLARFLDPHGQRPRHVVEIHAAAALLGTHGVPNGDDLIRESRVEALVSAIRCEGTGGRLHSRRATTIADTGRRSLVEATDLLATSSDDLDQLAQVRRDAACDLARRSTRLVGDADLEFQVALGALFQRFHDWADRHYQSSDSEIEERWRLDEGDLRRDAAELIQAAEARLRRRLRQLDEDVAKAWSKRITVTQTARSPIEVPGLSPRWLEAAGRTAAGAAGTLLGFAIGTAIGNAPGAYVGSAVGGILGERLGTLLRVRRPQLARRRRSLAESVHDSLEVARRDIEETWNELRTAVEQALARRDSGREWETEQIAALASELYSITERARSSVAAVDRSLIGALLRLEGRHQLAEEVVDVMRQPGFASLVPLAGAALREFVLFPPTGLLEDVRPLPGGDPSIFRRAAYGLAVGRRHALLVPDGAVLRADVPEPSSAEFLAVEAALVSAAIGFPIHLRSTLEEAAA